LSTFSFALLVGSLQAEFAYVVNYSSNNVSAYRIGENGALKPRRKDICSCPLPDRDPST
jgi:6-phosphogluconolactonase (cycloisomerase 2 family)